MLLGIKGFDREYGGLLSTKSDIRCLEWWPPYWDVAIREH